MSETVPVKVLILGKEYRIACQQDEKDDLLAAARYLDDRMRHIRSNSQISGGEKIAVLAALNIAHELTQSQQQNVRAEDRFQGLAERLHAMQDKIDQVLTHPAGE